MVRFPLRSGEGQEYIRKELPLVAARMLGSEVCTPQRDMKDKQQANSTSRQ